MNIYDSTVGEMVAQNPRAAGIFEKYRIDFCCNGHRTLREACTDASHAEALETELAGLAETPASQGDPYLDYRQWPADLLTDFIEKKLHRETTRQIAVIQKHLEKICRVHGKSHPQLFEIRDLFDKSAGELAMHMKREELVLFPFIRKMVQTGKTPAAPFGTIENPIRVLMHEHQDEGERFQKIASLTNDYAAPADGCTTFRLTFAELKEFESMLHYHIHLENNLLFPAASKMAEANPS